MKLPRRRIRELILNFFHKSPRLSDKQVVLAVRVIAPHANPSSIARERRELTRRGEIIRSRYVHREPNGRLVNLYEIKGGPKHIEQPDPMQFR